MSHLGIFRLEFGNTFAIFEISKPGIIEYANFHAKIKILKYRTKFIYFGIFGLKFEKAIVMFEVNTLDFF